MMDTSNITDNSFLQVKIICLGDSAVGKSKLVDRYLQDKYKPVQNSTYALQLYNHITKVNGEEVKVTIWDTAGQEMFQSMHASYYHKADACILVFDATRKVTYRSLFQWLEELRKYRPCIPVLCAANKIDANQEIAKKSFGLATQHKLPLYYVSASDGTNVVKLFTDAITAAVHYNKENLSIEDHIVNVLDEYKTEEYNNS